MTATGGLYFIVQIYYYFVFWFFRKQSVEMLSRLGLPTASDCASYLRYLPNKYNPSDHLPLVAEFSITWSRTFGKMFTVLYKCK